MAEYGEWTKKGATLSDVTAKKEYGVERELIIKGINEGKLEYREGVVWGNPYIRILRRQLEQYITEQPDREIYMNMKNQADIRGIKKEIASLKKKINDLEMRKTELENRIRK